MKDMVAGKDIYRVSIPMAAGAAAGALIFSLAQNIKLQHITTSIAGMAICAVLAFAIFGRQRESISVHVHIFWQISFFLLGLFCFASRMTVISCTSPLSGLDGIKASFAGAIDNAGFSDGECTALVKALILGDRSGMSSSTIQAFRSAGAAHLLALSGMHLGMIYLCIEKLLGILGNSIRARKIRNIIIIVSTGFYTLLCGAGPSLVRAWLFILLAETAKFLGRRQPPQQIFCAALTLHLVLHPENISELGFQLSYLALVGIVFVWPAVREWYSGRSLGARIWQACSLAICCQLFTAPLTLWHFGTFPRYFLITNLVAAPLTGVVMLCGIGATLLSSAGIMPWLIPLLEVPVSILLSIIKLIASL